MRKFSIKHWSEEDQPRKKLMSRGSTGLSSSELLAILINNGTKDQSALDLAKSLLQRTENDLRKLAALSVKEIVNLRIKGLGEAKAISIAAALELGLRRNASETKRKTVSKSGDIANYLQAMLAHKKQEVFAIVLLNRSNKITHLEIISEGGITGTVADPRVILKKAIEHFATGIILSHNHPSGSLQPSRADEAITQKIKQAAGLLDIQLMDHIIVSEEGYFSFADEGMI